MDKINEYNLGHLIYFFELACAMSGKILGVNPFDQPGVEKYKTNMFRLLGKPGYDQSIISSIESSNETEIQNIDEDNNKEDIKKVSKSKKEKKKNH